jgi:WD40 repeat protein
MDGRWVISSEPYGKNLFIRELSSGRIIRTFEGHTDRIFSACLSADGRWAISGSKDKTLRLWENATGLCLRTFEEPSGNIHSLVISPDNLWVLSFGNGTQLLEVSTGRCVYKFEWHHALTSACWSADARWALFGCSDGSLQLWEFDWDYQFPGWTEWDERARPYLETFLTLHTPYMAFLPLDRQPTEEEIQAALTRRGRPTWTDLDFKELLTELKNRGYGWLRPEGVRQELEKMAANWQGPPDAP